MSQNGSYIGRSWAMLRRDKGWIKPILVLTCAQFVPIVGSMGVSGYAYEWARLTAWGVDAAPKQKGVRVSGCIESGFRAFVVGLCYGAIAGLVMLPFTLLFGGIVGQLLRACITPVASIVGTIASLRAVIYQRISAGFQLERIWDMIRADYKGLLKILAALILFGLAIGIIVALFVMVIFVPLGMNLAMNLRGYSAYDLQNPDSEVARYIVAQVLGSLGAAAPLLVIMVFVVSLLTVTMTLIGTNAVGLWMRQFNVPAWGSSTDPLPVQGGLPPAGATYGAYGQPQAQYPQSQYPQGQYPQGQYPQGQYPQQGQPYGQAGYGYPAQQPYGQPPATPGAGLNAYGNAPAGTPMPQQPYAGPASAGAAFVPPAEGWVQQGQAPVNAQGDPNLSVPGAAPQQNGGEQAPVMPMPMMQVPQGHEAAGPAAAPYGAVPEDANPPVAAADSQVAGSGEEVVETIDLTPARAEDQPATGVIALDGTKELHDLDGSGVAADDLDNEPEPVEGVSAPDSSDGDSDAATSEVPQDTTSAEGEQTTTPPSEPASEDASDQEAPEQEVPAPQDEEPAADSSTDSSESAPSAEASHDSGPTE